jgi:hypothetical protein
MNRRSTILAVLGAVLIVALTWVLLYQPRNEEIAELQAATVAAEARGAELAIRVDQLRVVRETAPEIEAQLVAGTAVIPSEPALAAVLRQVQLSADEAGVTLMSMAPGRPEPVTIEGGAEGLVRLALVVDVEGEYFQMVDFLRRLEDPAISPRGLVWNGGTVGSEYDEYPTLTASLQGELFAIMPVLTPVPVPEVPVDGATDQDPDAVTNEDEAVDPADDVEVES